MMTFRRDRLTWIAYVVLGWFAFLQASPGLVIASLLGIGLRNLFPLGTSLTMTLAPGQAVLASGRVVVMTSLAGLLAPLTVGPLADATTLTAALGVVPVLLAFAAAGLILVGRAPSRVIGARRTSVPPPCAR
jgi:fucose permease